MTKNTIYTHAALALLLVAPVLGCSLSGRDGSTDTSGSNALTSTVGQAEAQRIADAYRAATPTDFTLVDDSALPKRARDLLDSLVAKPTLASVATMTVQGLGTIFVVEAQVRADNIVIVSDAGDSTPLEYAEIYFFDASGTLRCLARNLDGLDESGTFTFGYPIVRDGEIDSTALP